VIVGMPVTIITSPKPINYQTPRLNIATQGRWCR